MAELDIKKYNKQLDEKARGLNIIHKNLGKLPSYDFLKHAEMATNSFLRENELSWEFYHDGVRNYIINRANNLSKEERLKKHNVEQLSLDLVIDKI